MREEAFRRFLAPRLGARSVNSYLSDLRRVEDILQRDLDARTLDDEALTTIRLQLRRSNMNSNSLSNCLNALRAYASFQRQSTGVEAMLPDAEAAMPSIRNDHPQIALPSATTAELLANDAAILGELRARGITLTGNGPVGDYAEHLFARAFGWTLEANSTAGFDARDPLTTLRYEVKARRLTPAKRTAQLSALRGLPERRFDMLAVLLFAPDFSVDTAALIPHELVLQRAAYIAHTNSWRLVVTPALLALPRIEDVTGAIRALVGGDTIST